MNLQELGWNRHFEQYFHQLKTEGIFPARVATAQREKYQIYGNFGELKAEISGKFRFRTSANGDFPVVGDWVASKISGANNLAIIEAILPRLNKFSRKTAGKLTAEQVLVANINILFLVSGLDSDFNLRRIERYLTLALESNARPVILLNKTDLCPQLEEKKEAVASIAAGIPIHTLSALRHQGIEELKKYINPGTTVAFLGSSGVGKSTIINCLLGEDKLKVGAVRESDSRGRHITTRRELLIIPQGGMVVDTPGLRELQLWSEENTLETNFPDISKFAAECKFRDCEHLHEPECAVQRAIASGELDSKRFQSYLKLKKEIRYLATRKEKAKSRNTKKVSEKRISKLVKQIEKHKKRFAF
jgi:ribosome biogenesis GTPase